MAMGAPATVYQHDSVHYASLHVSILIASAAKAAMHNCARFPSRAARSGLRVTDASTILDAIACSRANTKEIPIHIYIPAEPCLDLAMEDGGPQDDLYTYMIPRDI